MTMEAAGLSTFRAAGGAHGHDPGLEAGERLVAAVAGGNYGRIFDVLTRDVRFRYLIPPGPGQVAGAADVAAKYFEWFGDVDGLEVQETLAERVSDRVSVRYRFLFRTGADWKLAEQQAYLAVDSDGRIVAIDLVCSGFRPTNEPVRASTTGDHAFDAGTMGCADGLASEFRRQIGGIPVGDALVVTARDPAAKEDLPPLARLMGHTVHSVEALGDGRLVITVERGR
jgi:TusA-related sulfurtransferase